MSKPRDIADSAATINFIDGVTSNVQTQLDAKGTGTVTSVGGTGAVNGLTLTGTVTGSGNLTLGGSLDDINLASGVTGTLPVANGGTGAATLTANNVLLGNGTSAPLEVAPSTSGNILTSNGTTWQSTAPASGGGFILLGTATTTGASTIDLTGFSDTYQSYQIEIVQLGSTSSGSAIRMQYILNGSLMTSSNYDWNLDAHPIGSTGASLSQGYGTYITVDVGYASNTTDEEAGYTFRIYNARHNAFKYVIWQGGSLGYGSRRTSIGQGIYNAGENSDMTGVRFFTSSGNIRGTFRLYGLVK